MGKVGRTERKVYRHASTSKIMTCFTKAVLLWSSEGRLLMEHPVEIIKISHLSSLEIKKEGGN